MSVSVIAVRTVRATFFAGECCLGLLLIGLCVWMARGLKVLAEAAAVLAHPIVLAGLLFGWLALRLGSGFATVQLERSARRLS